MPYLNLIPWTISALSLLFCILTFARNDRMIACLEELYDQAKSEHERERLRETIDRIRRDQ